MFLRLPLPRLQLPYMTKCGCYSWDTFDVSKSYSLYLPNRCEAGRCICTTDPRHHHLSLGWRSGFCFCFLLLYNLITPLNLQSKVLKIAISLESTDGFPWNITRILTPLPLNIHSLTPTLYGQQHLLALRPETRLAYCSLRTFAQTTLSVCHDPPICALLAHFVSFRISLEMIFTDSPSPAVLSIMSPVSGLPKRIQARFSLQPRLFPCLAVFWLAITYLHRHVLSMKRCFFWLSEYRIALSARRATLSIFAEWLTGSMNNSCISYGSCFPGFTHVRVKDLAIIQYDCQNSKKLK